MGKTWWFVEAGRPGPGDEENGESQGRAVVLSIRQVLISLGGLVETSSRRPSHQAIYGTRGKCRTDIPWDELQAQEGKARTGHLALPCYVTVPLWGHKKVKSRGLLNQLLEHYWECLHSEASGVRPALKSECHNLLHVVNQSINIRSASKGTKTQTVML